VTGFSRFIRVSLPGFLLAPLFDGQPPKGGGHHF